MAGISVTPTINVIGLVALGNGLVNVSAGTLGVDVTQYAVYGEVTKQLFKHYADANNSGTNETDLYLDTLAAGQLTNNGECMYATYAGIFAGSGTSTQELRGYFGGTKIFDSGALSIGAATDSWNLFVSVVRESATIARCSCSLTTNFATLSSYATYTKVTGLTLANTQEMKITGQAGGIGGASSQITASMGMIEWVPALV